MNLDAFAFFNQQLAGMLNNGIPLEGALRQLASNLDDPKLKVEIQALEKDLGAGVKFADAMQRRDLPDLYRRLLTAAAPAGKLPAMLILLADYYRQKHTLWVRFKGLMLYPILVLGAAALVSGLVAFLLSQLDRCWVDFIGWNSPRPNGGRWLVWAPFGVSLLALLAGLAALGSAHLREWLSWKLPGFRECRLAAFAGSMQVVLAGGVPLPEAIALLRDMEEDEGANQDLKRWEERLKSGAGRMEEFAAGSQVIPPMFVWLVSQSGGDLAGGFGRAARLYLERSRFRLEMMLYALLPTAVICLGVLIVIQAVGGIRAVASILDMLGGLD